MIAHFTVTLAASAGALSAPGAAVVVAPTEPPSLTLRVQAGEVAAADGRRVGVQAGELVLRPPETVALRLEAKAPGDHASWFDAWHPWPKKGRDGAVGAVTLNPGHDSTAVPILGGLYRQILPESIRVTEAGSGRAFAVGIDYRVQPDWGQIAGIGGHLGAPGTNGIVISGTARLQRLDLVQAGPDGTVSVKTGASALVCPVRPDPDTGCTPLASVYISGTGSSTPWTATAASILPIRPVEPVAPIRPEAVAGVRAKLRAGGPVKVAFIGDSLTLGAEAGRWWADDSQTWRGRVRRALQLRFAGAQIQEISAYQGGQGIEYGQRAMREKVLPAKPDLLFVCMGLNDVSSAVGQPPKQPVEVFERGLGEIVAAARGAGIDVVLVVAMPPHAGLADGSGRRWPMYREAQLRVAAEHGAGVADVCTAWQDLAAQGIPPDSQLHNCINHPGSFGHQLFADVVLRFFPDTDAAADATARATAPAPATPVASQTQPFTPTGSWKRAAQPFAPTGSWIQAAQPFPPLAAVIPPQAPPPRHLYGLYTWANEYLQHRASIRRVGWTAVRFGGPWTDAIMQAVAEDGVEVMLTLGLYDAGAKRTRADYPTDDAFVQDYTNGLARFLMRYGPGGTYFLENPAVPARPVAQIELWNEPNFQYMIPDDKNRPRTELEGAREQLYTRILTAGYTAIKGRWPGVTVVGFGAGGSSCGDVRFIEHVHAQAAAVAASYDILSTHPYAHGTPPETDCIRSWGAYSMVRSLASIRSTLARHGRADAPIWYTEVGWPVSQRDGGHFADRAGDGTVSPLLQAAHVVRTYALALRLGVSRVNIMFVTDSDRFNGGFFLRNGTWRPSATAVQTMIRQLPQPRLLEAPGDGADGTFVYVFSAGGKTDERVTMVWNVAGPRRVHVAATGPVTVTDMLGQTLAATAVDGAVTVDAGPCPVYVQRQP